MSRDEFTRDALQTRLRLQGSLVFRPERSRAGTWYHIECREQRRFFRIGRAEYTFISLLDGETTLAEAISLTARESPHEAFTEDQALVILVWLLENGLATVIDVAQSNAQSRSALFERRQERKTLERLNPLWLKIPLANPDRLVTSLTKMFSWIHSVPAMLLAGAIAIAALLTLPAAWSELTQSARKILARDNWLWLSLTWLFLKCVHEASHAIACKRFGGTIPETGVIFVLLAPVAYVDVTSSLRFQSKWQRIQIAAAGMYVELLIAACALLLWQQIDAELPRYLLYNMIVMAGFTTLIFNANPLMRFDGYFILSDLLELPNLASRGSESIKRLVRRVLFGVSTTGVQESSYRSRFIATYGFLALLWRVVVSIGLLITASTLFHGLGLSLAILGLLVWCHKTLVKWLRDMTGLLSRSPARCVRALMILIASAALLAGVLSAPWPATRTAPGLVEYRDLAVVRAGSPGFVTAVHVHDGQEVQSGDLLLELQNPELAAEVGDLQSAVRQSELKYHRLLKEQKTADAQVESGNKVALEKRLFERQRQFNSLIVTAPQAGRVMSRLLPSLLGTFAEQGDELLAIGDDTRKEFLASVAQSDVSDLLTTAGVTIRLQGIGRMTGHVRQVIPRASQEPLHMALTAMAGGPLPVRPISLKHREQMQQQSEFELLEPRVNVLVALDDSSSVSMTAGTTGRLTIPGNAYPSLGVGLYRSAQQWLEHQIANTSNGSQTP